MTVEMRQEPTTVLVVDDEEVLRRVGKRTLERQGHRVLVAADGPEALEQMARHGDAIAWVLLDLTLPGMGGAEVLRALRAQKPGLPVVLVSGGERPDVSEGFLEQDLESFLRKPYSAADLKACVTALLSPH